MYIMVDRERFKRPAKEYVPEPQYSWEDEAGKMIGRSFVNTATGEDLDAVAKVSGVPRHPNPDERWNETGRMEDDKGQKLHSFGYPNPPAFSICDIQHLIHGDDEFGRLVDTVNVTKVAAPNPYVKVDIVFTPHVTDLSDHLQAREHFKGLLQEHCPASIMFDVHTRGRVDATAEAPSPDAKVIDVKHCERCDNPMPLTDGKKCPKCWWPKLRPVEEEPKTIIIERCADGRWTMHSPPDVAFTLKKTWTPWDPEDDDDLLG